MSEISPVLADTDAWSIVAGLLTGRPVLVVAQTRGAGVRRAPGRLGAESLAHRYGELRR